LLSYAYADCDIYAYADGHCYSDLHAYSHSDGNCYRDGNSHSNGYVYPHTNADSDTDTTRTDKSDHADRDNLSTVQRLHGRDP
jgi:hypothetical protein